MVWFFVAFLGRLCFACCNILDGHFRNSEFRNPFSQIFFFNLYMLPILAGLYFSTDIQPLPHHLMLWTAVAGAMFFLYVVPYLEALRIADTSTVVSLFTLGRAFVPILALPLIGERLSLLEFLGFIIVLGGGIFHAYEPQRVRINSRLILLMGGSGIMIAIYSVCSKRVFEEIRWFDGVFYIYLVDVLLCTSLLAIPALRPDLIRTVKLFPAIALSFFPIVLFSIGGNILIFYAISLTKVSYVTMTAQFQALLALLIGWAVHKFGFLKSRESLATADVRQKLIGFIIMAFGMWLTLWSANS